MRPLIVVFQWVARSRAFERNTCTCETSQFCFQCQKLVYGLVQFSQDLHKEAIPGLCRDHRSINTSRSPTEGTNPRKADVLALSRKDFSSKAVSGPLRRVLSFSEQFVHCQYLAQRWANKNTRFLSFILTKYLICWDIFIPIDGLEFVRIFLTCLTIYCHVLEN